MATAPSLGVVPRPDPSPADWRLPGRPIPGELFKRALGYRQPTGDWFALIVPAGIALGRLGCWLNGCCLCRVCETSAWWTVRDEHGLPRWPPVPLEFGFNLIALVVLTALRKARKFPGNLFHLNLIAYGLFRLVHEGFRDTPRALGPFSGYSLLALGLIVFGTIRFVQRERETHGASHPTVPPLASALSVKSADPVVPSKVG